MLELVGIRKAFNKGTPDEAVLFDDFNFSVKKGEFVSIVGSNGSGKTTLLNLVGGAVLPDAGKVVLDGENITDQKEFIRARKIGRVFQDPSGGTANHMTIAENMALAENKGKRYGLGAGLGKKRGEYYRELLRPLGLGLEDKLNVPVGSLSGGQRQLLTLIIATMTPIDLLLLDEHTAALDPKTAEETMRLTDQIVREKQITTLMVTHNLRFAVEYGTRICMFDKGHVVLDKAGEEKKNIDVDELLRIFNEISIECGN
ncbi:MAG TPA: ATP-binding cassette domain-containing protein [Candidatus Borkfalkia avistercoris]|uniref:ATP-binding cassette domain-containing protein n=1 Tax=Candidatus Borkfalkia avistercoris TaxID=2838504 RepID=A0A9D2IDU2_9FIRM|nr:ATP-binding cassette domain-containing protein [Candidatus Borkfalkia avistercoris]